MCPEAAARTASPATMNAAPAPIHVHAGCANHKYAAANANPRGTRPRVAMRDQLATDAPQEVSRRADHFVSADFQQSRVRVAMVRESCLALRMPQGNRVATERASADRVGGSIQADCGNVLRAGQMQWTGVAADENSRAPGQSDQLTHAALDHESIAVARIHHRLCQTFLAGSGVDQCLQV